MLNFVEYVHGSVCINIYEYYKTYLKNFKQGNACLDRRETFSFQSSNVLGIGSFYMIFNNLTSNLPSIDNK